MTSVINLLDFREQMERPTLVLVGLHKPLDTLLDASCYQQAFANCRHLLAHARASGTPVAFARRVAPPANMNAEQDYPPWLDGFKPTRSDMVFDVPHPSCYSSPEFHLVTEYSKGNFAIAGLFGESSCLATVLDAYHRRHRVTYLSDGSVCRPPETVTAASFHEAVNHIISLYADVMRCSAWREAHRGKDLVR